jgi:hypothetical protein
MKKHIIFFLLTPLVLMGTPNSTSKVLPLQSRLEPLRIPPTKRLPDTTQIDAFGLNPRGSLTVKKEVLQAEQEQPQITLSQVATGLHLYGVFPRSEALINSLLWRVKSRITVRYLKRDYVLILNEVTESHIKIGWLNDESIHEISLTIPVSEAMIETPAEIETENSESILVLDTPQRDQRIETREKKR